MNIKKNFKIALLYVLFIFLSGCGLAGQDDECENPHPSQKAECEARESSEWNKMNWNEGTWG